MTDAPIHGTARLEAVDSLRGIAATGVVIVHSLAMFDLGPTGVIGIGYLVLGVPLFFVISAFSMSLAYDGGIATAAAWKRYALRRFFRIAPLFYVMLAVWLVYYHHLGSPFGGIGMLATNLTFIFGITQDGIVPAGWSIGVEQTYSLPVPLSLVTGWSLAFFLIVLSQSLGATVLLDNRVTRFLGKISYSLYLSHPFVIYATGIPLLVKGWLGAPTLALAVPLVTLALAVPVALALYHLIERPFMSLGRRLTP